MTLHFPNESRSFDAMRNCVQFCGYDGALGISFFVEADALQKLGRVSLEATDLEAQVLGVFDAARKHIHRVAGKVYGRGRTGEYVYCLEPNGLPELRTS